MASFCKSAPSEAYQPAHKAHTLDFRHLHQHPANQFCAANAFTSVRPGKRDYKGRAANRTRATRHPPPAMPCPQPTLKLITFNYRSGPRLLAIEPVTGAILNNRAFIKDPHPQSYTPGRRNLQYEVHASLSSSHD